VTWRRIQSWRESWHAADSGLAGQEERMSEADDFLALVAGAQLRSAEGDWADAAALWARVTAANPVNGDYWARLAEARFGNEEYEAARQAYEKVRELGVRSVFRQRYRDDAPQLMPGEIAYHIACCQAALGRRDEAIDALAAALAAGFRELHRARDDKYWQPWQDDERLRELLGIIDADALPRDQGWRFDLALLAREIKRLAYAPFGIISEEEFDRQVARLDRDIPALSDAQVLVAMLKLVRHLDDGHAGVWPPDKHDELSRMLPVDFFLFTEGLFVIAAGPGHEKLLGARVEKIGDLTVEEAITALDPIIVRDNEQQVTFKITALLRSTAVLQGLGIIDDLAGATLTICADGTREQITLAAEPGESRLYRYPPDWTELPDTVPGNPRPLHLRHRDLPYWFEYLPAADLVYFQYNAVRNHPAETFAAFCDRLFGFIAERRPARLVLDVRWNGGGNTFLSQALLHHLIGCPAINHHGALFVIIGRLTFSAAQNTVTAIDRETSAIFVGEPTGSRPNFIGESIWFELPYSKVRANAADLFWQTSWPDDHRPWVAPDIYTPPTFDAYRRNQDPAMDAILAIRENVPGADS
jgi:tetratricopeptide (TPR) repeat protein